MTDNKASLMASLTGAQGEPEQDLFGEIPIDQLDEEEAPPPAVTPQPMPAPAAEPRGQLIIEKPLDETQNSNPLSMSMPAVPVSQPLPAASKQKTSLLASSGLLGGQTNGGGGGGLFDEIDKEEEEKERQQEAKRQEEAKKQQQEELRRRQEEEERRRLAEEQMMRTVSLSSSVAYPPQQQQQQQQPQQYQQMMPPMTEQMQNMSLSTPAPMSFTERSQMMQQQAAVSQYFSPLPTTGQFTPHQLPQQAFSPGGFYRPHSGSAAAVATSQVAQAAYPVPGQPNTFYYSNTGGDVQTHTISTQYSNSVSASPGRLPHGPSPSLTAGMHNSMSTQIRPRPIVQPAPFEPIYGQVVVSEPLLVQPPSLFNVVPPHWTYQVQTTLKEGGCWLVRRRFRHIVALEDRLHLECPGSILPPRPDKHATRAIEEASAMQSAEFAMQRAAEMQVYLNDIVHHPHAGKASSLKLFLALQDDMGTAWPEVSSNALTRLGAVSGAAVQNVSDTHLPWESNAQDALEDNAELLALANSEGIRMGAVTQAVPKLEGAVTLMREHGEAAGACGMELNKLSKTVEASDRDLGVPLDLLSQGLLRYGRRQKRLVLELSAAMNPFITQYKICKYEKTAFQDRRSALQRRVKERGRADVRAQRLMVHQRGLQHQGALGELERLERDASVSDEVAVGAVHYCDVIGATLKSEVNRVAFQRRTEWSKSMKVLCSALKEAAAEHKSIWESTRENFLQAYPEFSSNADE